MSLASCAAGTQHLFGKSYASKDAANTLFYVIQRIG